MLKVEGSIPGASISFVSNVGENWFVKVGKFGQESNLDFKEQSKSTSQAVT